MFCGRRYAAYACINAVYIRTLNGVHSTGKKTPILCVCTAGRDRIFEVGRHSRVGVLEVPPHRLNYSTQPTIR